MSVDCGGNEWAVVGAAIAGGFFSLAGTMLADCLKEGRARKLDRVRENTLRKRFAASNREWVPIQKLMDAIGADRETTIRHLLMIDARRSMAGNDSWGLKGWPDVPAKPDS
jgi:hypothetical protein